VLKKLLLMTAGLALSVAVAAANSAPRTDLQVFNDVAAAVNRYPMFTVFDDVNVGVHDGVVTLTGSVTMPYKRNDIEKQVKKVDGVTTINNTITVLPVSIFDNDLRYRIARSIYGNATFWKYAAMANPPIHIVVDNGRVTLTGVVNNEVERMLARSLATQHGALSVTNDLKTDAEMRDALEHIS
jgi:hyperosmotically inducible protein